MSIHVGMTRRVESIKSDLENERVRVEECCRPHFPRLPVYQIDEPESSQGACINEGVELFNAFYEWWDEYESSWIGNM